MPTSHIAAEPSLESQRELVFASPLTVRAAAQDVGQAEGRLFRLLGQPLTARQGFAWQPGGAGLHRGADANPGGGQEAFRTPGFRLHLGVQALQFLMALTKARCDQRCTKVQPPSITCEGTWWSESSILVAKHVQRERIKHALVLLECAGPEELRRCSLGDNLRLVIRSGSCAQAPGDGVAWVRGLVPQLAAAMPAAPSRTTPELRAAYNAVCVAAWGDSHIVSACAPSPMHRPCRWRVVADAALFELQTGDWWSTS